MKDSDLHVYAGIGTALVVALLATPVYVLAGTETLPGLQLTEVESIEAELAMKSDTKKQPDKPPPPPKDPDEKIGGDANAKPEVCKQDADCGAGKLCKQGTCVADKSKPDSPDVQMPPRRYTEDDATAGEATLPDLGQFDGDERGFAQKSSGHPYMQQLAADVHESFEYPELLKGQGSVDVCVRLTPEGKIIDTKKWGAGSGNPEIDDSGERAVKKMIDKRNADPQIVPTELLAKGVTIKWLCFRLTP
jgi:outer membrane biosynthesis protein TonB